MIMYGLVFILGLVLGSFYNVVALRTLSGENLAFPPSHCSNCNHQLHRKDLVPVFSWLFLKGKCRYCGDKISPIYPIGELLTATSYTIIFHQFGLTMEGLIQLVFITVMIWATMSDLKATMVPDRFVVIGILSVFILRTINEVNLVYYLISMLVAFGLLLFILIASNGKIGWQSSLASLFYASIIAILFQIPGIVKNKGVERGREIPFVPFITLGVLCTYFLDIFNLVL